MKVMDDLRERFRPPKYNPDEDQSVKTRIDISERTERLIRMAEEIHRRIDTGNFPILLDDRSDKW